MGYGAVQRVLALLGELGYCWDVITSQTGFHDIPEYIPQIFRANKESKILVSTLFLFIHYCKRIWK